jgi:hypothetical protein
MLPWRWRMVGWIPGAWSGSFWGWLADLGWGDAKSYVAPLMVVALVTPLVVVLSLLLVAVLMTPALVALVAQRRFHLLERKKGGSFVLSLGWSVGSTVLALVAMVVSMPLWLIPPLVLILPPLIWGWLTYRVMAFDALADHASRAERAEIFADTGCPCWVSACSAAIWVLHLPWSGLRGFCLLPLFLC